MPDLITKMVPILHVKDPGTERDFYVAFGLRTTYEGPEYPGFIAVGNDAVEFGLSANHETGTTGFGLTWQLQVADVEEAIAICRRQGFSFEVATEQPRPDWTYRVVTVRSPNGWNVLLEEETKGG